MKSEERDRNKPGKPGVNPEQERRQGDEGNKRPDGNPDRDRKGKGGNPDQDRDRNRQGQGGNLDRDRKRENEQRR